VTFATSLTLLRILMVPLFAGALLYHREYYEEGYTGNGWYYAAICFFALASLTDGVDGWIARHFHQQSHLGRILDPIADKLLLVTGIVLLGTVGVAGKGRLPLWFPILVVSRDFILVTGTLFLGTLLHNYHFVKPHWTGKVCTFFQIAVVLLGLLLPGHSSTWPILWAAGAMTSLSMVIYLKQGWDLLHQSNYGKPTQH
jgi:CDP-diacylglycerol--glycerol-3-phosphate 3-phosphatidyltransferase/cardiolipin synthase